MLASYGAMNGADEGGVLEGVRILDMATFVAAPFAATLCADLGAQVVKLELPEGKDPLRAFHPLKDGRPIYWKVTNRGKRGITLDVRTSEGREVFLELIRHFDVLVENFRTGAMARWGLDLATLHRSNPSLTVLRLTGFGQTGPFSTRPGFARIFEAMSGLANLCGEADGAPQHPNHPVGDMIAGVFGAFSLAAAMVERRARPHAPGREIDLSATESLLRLLDVLPAEHELLGIDRKRSGSRATYTAPSNVYESQDGVWITIAASSDAIFARLCGAMERPDLARDPRFATSAARVRLIEAVDRIVAQWCASQDADSLARALENAEVPFSRVNSGRDLLEQPQLLFRKAICRMPDADFGSLPVPCVVPRFGPDAPPVPRSGPALGEHTDEVLSELGWTKGRLDELRERGII